MSSENFKESLRQRLLSSKIANILDVLKRGEWPIILFAILSLHSLRLYLCSKQSIFQTDSFSFIVIVLIYPLVLFLLNYFLKIRDLYPFFNNYMLVFSLVYFIAFFSFFLIWGNWDVALSCLPYLFYLYNISFLYLNSRIFTESESRKVILDNLKYLKTISFAFHLISFLVYILLGKTDPLYITVFFCVTPFFVVCLFINRIGSIYLMYRLLFLILFFFISAISTPYLFVLGLFLMWFGKLYYFMKYNIKYPSFYNSYDIS